jgi:hypothetical protein
VAGILVTVSEDETRALREDGAHNGCGPSALSAGAAPPATVVAEVGYALGESDCALKVVVVVRLWNVVDEAVDLEEAFLAMNEKERGPGLQSGKGLVVVANNVKRDEKKGDEGGWGLRVGRDHKWD